MTTRVLTLAAVVTFLCTSSTQATEVNLPAAPKAKLVNCPVSLSNPDGQDLLLEKMDMRVAVQGPLSLTEVEVVFRNPEARQMEGRFLYVLPTGATVSRFAKEVDGNLMEGEVVETQAARRAYREILHTMRDPALLEQDQGNRFSAKVFPIPANGTARLVLSYSRVTPMVEGERKLVFPMLGMPKIGEFKFQAVIQPLPGEELCLEKTFVGEGKTPVDFPANRVTKFSKLGKDWQPESDWQLVFQTDKNVMEPKVQALRVGTYQLTVYRPSAFEKVEPVKELARDWVFYFDTSASGADTEARRTKLLTELFEQIDAQDDGSRELHGFAFDLGVDELFEATERSMKDGAPRFTGPVRMKDLIAAKLKARHALGATALSQALKHLGELARKTEHPACFVLVSDGIPTWSANEIPELLAALGDWPKQHVMDVLVCGSKQDEKVLAAVTAKTGGRVVVASLNEEPESSAQVALAALRKPMGRVLEFYDEGAEWIYPNTARDVQSNSELMVFSQLREGAEAKPGAVERIEGKPVDTPWKIAPKEVVELAPLLKQEAIRAQIAHLELLDLGEQDVARLAASRTRRVELSVKNRVLCAPLTSLLVLETEQDYAHFKIERTSLADIMVVGVSGIEMKARKADDLVLKKLGDRPKFPGNQIINGAPAFSTVGAISNENLNFEPSRPDLNGVQDLTEVRPDFPGPDYQVETVAPHVEMGGNATGGVGGGPFVALAPVPQATSATREEGEAERRGSEVRAQHWIAPAETEEPEPHAARAAMDKPLDGSLFQFRFLGVAPTSVPEGRAQQPAPPKRSPPGWLKRVGTKPSTADLAALLAQSAAQPFDRALRNAYADCLAQMNKWKELQAFCLEWLTGDSDNPQVYEYLGKSAAALGDKTLALRALSSVAEIAPHNSGLLGRAGWVLLATKHYELAVDLFQAALKERQDDANLYRGLALSYWLDGRFKAAAKVYEDALKLDFNERYGDVKRVLGEEQGYLYRAWIRYHETHPVEIVHGPDAPKEFETNEDLKKEVIARAKNQHVDIQHTDALRVTLSWETDANDVDLHVVDPNNDECWYSHKLTESNLELYSDQTQGLGPEVIRTETAIKGKYEIGVTYFNAGPMGVSRGVIVIFKSELGAFGEPQIIPFVLMSEPTGGRDIRPIATVKF